MLASRSWIAAAPPLTRCHATSVQMLIFAAAVALTAIPVALIEEPAVRRASSGQECRRLSESHGLGSDAIDEEHGDNRLKRLMVKSSLPAFAKTSVGGRLNERTAENCIRAKARIRCRRHTPLWRFQRRITAQCFN
jgi:hypothetical protein